jgi:glycine/D-amino acid oxidase-like deaminating enzyme
MREYPYEEFGPWVRQPTVLQPPLTADLEADVVVIGGGYTGLSTALALRESGTDVAIVEARFAGAGASGRNAGHLTPTIGKDIPTLLRMFGRERAARLVAFAEHSVAHTEEILRKYEIDCDYTAGGNLMAGVHPKHERGLRNAAEAARGFGADVHFADGNELRERGLPPAFLFGVFEERGGVLDPGRYVTGLRRAALDAGVRLFENSPLVSLEQGPRIVVRTPRGSVRAPQAVLATNAFTTATGLKPRTVAPLRVSLFESDVLSENDLARLDWRGREGVYTAHEVLESFRMTARNTVVGGSKVVRYAYGGALAPPDAPEAFGAIESSFRARFPQLANVGLARFWSGWIGLTLDFLPVLGVEGTHRNLFYGLGYCGHGVSQATLMGSMLAERMQGREHQREAALRRRTWSWPPEPFRWVAANLVQAVLTALDRNTDRQIRSLPRP